MWVYEFTCPKCREVFVRSLGPGRAIQCPACGSSALEARLDPLSELIPLLVSAATQSIRGLRQRIGRGYATRSRWVADGR
jgi:DNA-directed RNA polymerase subunit RPC12/RpoP